MNAYEPKGQCYEMKACSMLKSALQAYVVENSKTTYDYFFIISRFYGDDRLKNLAEKTYVDDRDFITAAKDQDLRTAIKQAKIFIGSQEEDPRFKKDYEKLSDLEWSLLAQVYYFRKNFQKIAHEVYHEIWLTLHEDETQERLELQNCIRQLRKLTKRMGQFVE